MNDIFHFVKNANSFNYADDNFVSVNGKELSMLSHLLQSEAEVTVRWFSENAMEANPSKFQGIFFKGNKQVPDFNVSVDGNDIEFCQFMTALGICIDENLTFDIHIDNICLKASRQISALQRLTGLLDFPSRKAIYNSFISSHFNYCPRGEAMYISLFGFQWTSTETKSFSSLIIHNSIIITCVSYGNIFGTLVPKCINIVPL